MMGTRLGNDTVELVQVCVKIEHWFGSREVKSIINRKGGKRTVNSNPFHNIGIFRKHNNRLEVPFHKSSVGEGAA